MLQNICVVLLIRAEVAGWIPGFAQEHQVQLDPEDGRFGNRVTLVSDALSVPCDVERDSTHSQQILCYTRYTHLDRVRVRPCDQVQVSLTVPFAAP